MMRSLWLAAALLVFQRSLLWAAAFPQGGAAAPSAAATCGPDPIPATAAGAAAAAVGFTCETFYTNNPWSLTTDIDTNNTGGPNYKWYTNQNWVLSASFGGTDLHHWGTLGITYPADLSTPGGNLRLAPQAVTGTPVTSGHSGFLMTCGPTTTPPYYQGKAFSGGMYIEHFSSWENGDAGLTEQARPSVWFNSTSFLVTSKPYPFDFYEIDSYDNPAGRGFHVWTVTGGTPSDSATNCTGCDVSMPSNGHSFGVLLVPSALAGGTPRFEYYQDGILKGHQTPPGSFTQSVFDLAANDPTCLIIGAAFVNPATYNYVRVWQRPP
jgi:hypothetical protein